MLKNSVWYLLIVFRNEEVINMILENCGTKHRCRTTPRYLPTIPTPNQLSACNSFLFYFYFFLGLHFIFMLLDDFFSIIMIPSLSFFHIPKILHWKILRTISNLAYYSSLFVSSTCICIVFLFPFFHSKPVLRRHVEESHFRVN